MVDEEYDETYDEVEQEEYDDVELTVEERDDGHYVTRTAIKKMRDVTVLKPMRDAETGDVIMLPGKGAVPARPAVPAVYDGEGVLVQEAIPAQDANPGSPPYPHMVPSKVIVTKTRSATRSVPKLDADGKPMMKGGLRLSMFLAVRSAALEAEIAALKEKVSA